MFGEGVWWGLGELERGRLGLHPPPSPPPLTDRLLRQHQPHENWPITILAPWQVRKTSQELPELASHKSGQQCFEGLEGSQDLRDLINPCSLEESLQLWLLTTSLVEVLKLKVNQWRLRKVSIELQGRLRVPHFKQSFSDSSVLLFLEIEIESCPKTFFKEALEAPKKPPRISCCQ